MKGTYQIAQRIINAENNFIENVMAISGCSESDAWKVFDLYRKLKVIKRDAVNGVYNVKHGAFLDKEVIQNAINS